MKNKVQKEGRRFVVCIRTKIVRTWSCAKSIKFCLTKTPAKDGYIRVIDESGEGYLYPADYFLPIELSKDVENAFIAA